MTPGDIKDLMEYISASNFVEFEMEQAGFKLRLIKAGVPAAAPAPAAIAPTAGNASAPTPDAGTGPTPVPAPAAEPSEDLHEVKSPIVGTFFRAPNPEAPSFVEVGDKVKKGQVLCIVEAMKLMNEIESEVDGEVAEVVTANGQPVEYGEALFRLRSLS